MHLWKQRSLAVPPYVNARHFSWWSRSVLLIAALGSLVAGGWALHQSPLDSPAPDSLEGQQEILTLCEVLANPSIYDSKIIRLEARLVVHDGDRSLYDPACTTMEPMLGVEADPSLHYELGGKVQKEFYDLVRLQNVNKAGSADTIMVGRFEGPNFLKDGRKSRFQHQFIVMSIEKAEALLQDNSSTPDR